MGDVLMRATGITKDFPGLRALDDVELDVKSGEIVALVGHNGSGKSTLVKILAGVYRADLGRVEFTADQGETTELHIIHQDLGLVAELSTIENLGLAEGRGASAFGPTHPRVERGRAAELIARFGGAFDVTAPIATLTPAQRAIVAIARALDGWTHSRNVLILDEPTEALHSNETEVLFAAIRAIAREGAGVIFISHRLDEVLSLADRVLVLRDGVKVADQTIAGLSHEDLVTFVTGVETTETPGSKHRHASHEVLLDVQGLTGPGVASVDLTLRAGEVVGVAGVLGSGRDVLPSLLFGAERAEADGFLVEGIPYNRRTPRRSIARGMAFVAGDRARLGSVRAMNARENMTLPELGSVTGPVGVLRHRKEKAVAEALVQRYQVKPAATEQSFSQFSGGNQQKIVFAKWLRNAPSILLLEEPTQGVDIGAKQAIYDEIEGTAMRGAAVLVCSSDAKELMRLCDRVIVMREGRVAVELAGDALSESALIMHGYGLAADADTGTRMEEKAS